MEGLWKQKQYRQVAEQLPVLETLNCETDKLRLARLLTAKSHIALEEKQEAMLILARNLADNLQDKESFDLLQSIRDSK